MRIAQLLLFLFTVIGLPTKQLSAQEIFEYTPPKPLEAQQPSYPRRAAEDAKEGYVIYSFMIGTDGKAYDPIVSESTDSIFETPSLKAIESLRYEPATLNGEPVDAAHFYKFTYRMNGDIGVASDFLRTHRFFGLALEKGNLDEASKYHEKLVRMSSDNLYEMGWANLAGFRLAKARQLPQEQYRYLKKALAFHKKDRGSRPFISKENEPRARAELFRLQTELKLFSEASSTFRMMEERGDEAVNALRPVYQQITDIADSEGGYLMDASLDHDGYWSVGLHKRAFYIDKAEGRLSELKLHCSTKYAVFAYTEGSQYEVPDSWGNCDLIVIGDPDTKFALAQVKPAN